MIYTASHKNIHNAPYRLVAISGNRGKDAGFKGEAYPKLAPKKGFWQIWHDNIGKVSELENNRYYIEEYYKQVLSKLNPMEVYNVLDNSILLCYEDYNEFCHRHIVAAWLELTLHITIPEVYVHNYDVYGYIRPAYIKEILKDVMEQNQKLTLTK